MIEDKIKRRRHCNRQLWCCFKTDKCSKKFVHDVRRDSKILSLVKPRLLGIYSNFCVTRSACSARCATLLGGRDVHRF